MAKTLNDYLYEYYKEASETTAVRAQGMGLPVAAQTDSLSNYNKVTNPVVDAVIAELTSVPAGVWDVEVQSYVAGTPSPGLDTDNMNLRVNGVAFARILAPLFTGGANVIPVSSTFRVALTATGTIRVQAIAAGTAGSRYGAQIVATRRA